jgi:hypothetical protein
MNGITEAKTLGPAHVIGHRIVYASFAYSWMESVSVSGPSTQVRAALAERRVGGLTVGRDDAVGFSGIDWCLWITRSALP